MTNNRMKLLSLATATILCGATALAGAQTAGQGSGTMNGSNTGTMGNMQGNPPQGANQAGMQQGSMEQRNPSMGSVQSKTFVRKASQGNMAEVAMGKMALDKTSNDQVKQFAQKMVDDHNKLEDNLKPVAQQMNVTLPSEPNAKQQATATKMQALSGDAFDKAYMKDAVKDHKQDLADYKKEMASAQNPQLKDYVTQGEPIIQQHLDMAESTAQAVGAMGGKMSSKGSNTSGNGTTGPNQPGEVQH